jgi:hypothetical protein
MSVCGWQIVGLGVNMISRGIETKDELYIMRGRLEILEHRITFKEFGVGIEICYVSRRDS